MHRADYGGNRAKAGALSDTRHDESLVEEKRIPSPLYPTLDRVFRGRVRGRESGRMGNAQCTHQAVCLQARMMGHKGEEVNETAMLAVSSIVAPI
jgi:hypothetical protein